jgi:hypothetical protein
MFAAVRASRAIKRSSGRRKGRVKLLHSSTFYGGVYQTAPIYHAIQQDPQLQTSRVKDDNYTHIVPWNSNTRSGGASNTYLFQFTLSGLPLLITPGTGIVVPNEMLKFHSTTSTYSSAWNNMPSNYVLYTRRTHRSGRFRRTYTDYGYFRWMVYCVTGSTIQQAKYRLVPELTGATGSSSYSNRYLAEPLARFRNYVKTGSDATLKRVLGSYGNRGYNAFNQGQNVWGYGIYDVGQGYTAFSPYGYQLDLTFMEAPGKYLEWRRQ